jgi:hypothetical protein
MSIGCRPPDAHKEIARPKHEDLPGAWTGTGKLIFILAPRSASRIAMDFGGIDRASGKSKQNARRLTGAFERDCPPGILYGSRLP